MIQQRSFRQRISIFFDDYPWIFGALMFGIGILAGGTVMLFQINRASGISPIEETALQPETQIVTITPLPIATRTLEATPTPAFTPTFTPFQPVPTNDAIQPLATQQSSIEASVADNPILQLFFACSRIVKRVNSI